MAGQKGRSGSGGKRKGAGRPKGAVDAQPRFRIAKSLSVQKWEFAKYAQQYADLKCSPFWSRSRRMLKRREQHVSRLQAKVLDRALGKAKHIDVSALRHTEIVHRSAAEIRQELINEGVPEVLLDLKDANGK